MTVWTTACPDWAERIVQRRSLVPCPPLHSSKADEALGVFKSLQMTDLPMKRDGSWPTMGEVCEPFVFDLVGALFGAQDPKTGASLVKEAMLLISKKNGKSTIAAGIMLTALILNWRHEAELLVLAPTIEIANNSFGPAASMVRADEELSTMLRVIDHQRIIKHRETGAELKIVAADAGVVGGKKAGFVLVDELWLFGKKPNAEAMLEEATGGQAARPEGWTLYLSTHSDEPPAGVFKAKLTYFREVRDGERVDPTALPMLYEWPEELLEAEAYLDPANFYVTNPNIGKSPSVEFIARKIAQATAGEGTEGDSTLQIVLAKYLNVEIGLRLRRDRWRGADLWEGSADASLAQPGIAGLRALLARCEVAVAGVDGGGLDDLLGLSVAGREKGSDRWLFWFRAWAWDDVLQRRKDIAPMLRDFSAQGDLVILGKDAVADQDVAEAVEILEEVKASGLMPEASGIGLDPAGVGVLIDALAKAEFSVAEGAKGEVVAVSQGWALSSAIYAIERKLRHRLIGHGGRPLMNWVVGNARAELKGKNVYIQKSTAGSAKIDPLIAGFNAAKLLEINPVAGDGKVGIDDWIAGMRAA